MFMEGDTFGRALNFNERTSVGHHYVHIGMRLAILSIIEIEDGGTLRDTD